MPGLDKKLKKWHLVATCLQTDLSEKFPIFSVAWLVGVPKFMVIFVGPGDFFEFWYQPLNSKKAIPKDTVPISAFVGEMTGESSW